MALGLNCLLLLMLKLHRQSLCEFSGRENVGTGVL